MSDMTNTNNRIPAVFFDRDGVIIEDKDYQIEVDEIELFDDTIEALKTLDRRYLKIVVSNQSGIGRGYFSADDVVEFNRYLADLLKKDGIRIDGWYFCPHVPEDNCDCRKPGTGMITNAADDHFIDLINSWIIGDKYSDIMAGRASGIKTILIKTGCGGEDGAHSDVSPDYRADNLLMAIEMINRSLN